MTSSPISMQRSYRPLAHGWYEDRTHLGLPVAKAKAFVYAWHEENDLNACKIGYCSKTPQKNDPFEYLWDGNALSQQRRLPVIFLTVGLSGTAEAKKLETQIHSEFEGQHMDHTCSQEWFAVSPSQVIAAASESCPNVVP